MFCDSVTGIEMYSLLGETHAFELAACPLQVSGHLALCKMPFTQSSPVLCTTLVSISEGPASQALRLYGPRAGSCIKVVMVVCVVCEK